MDPEALLQPKYLVFAAVMVAVFLVVKRLLRQPTQKGHTAAVRCSRCGWSGNVSKYKPVCPKCGNGINA